MDEKVELLKEINTKRGNNPSQINTGNQFIVKSDDFVLFLFYLKMKDYQTLYGHI